MTMDDVEHDLPNDTALIATEAEAGERLDKGLAGLMPSVSRSRLKALILDGQITIAGHVVTDPARKLKLGDEIVVIVPPPEDAEPHAENIPLVIVFEDEHVIVVNKPAGMVVHPAPGNSSGTLVNALLHHCAGSLSGVGGVRRPGIVHRLDKDTSGLLVVAKHDKAHQALSLQFADHGREGPLVREYRAFVWGAPDRRSGTIDTQIDRSNSNRERMGVAPAGKGRNAITHYERLEIFGSDPKTPVASMIACMLETGRTHQIRVHLAHIGHPLLGDALYGSGFRTKSGLLSQDAQSALTALGSRQALHAAILGFAHPMTGETVVFESDLPPDLARLHAALAATQL